MSIKLLCNFNHERVFEQKKIIADSNGIAVFILCNWLRAG
jgi:hypothetical protein